MFSTSCRLRLSHDCTVCGQARDSEAEDARKQTAAMFGCTGPVALVVAGICPKCLAPDNDPAELRRAMRLPAERVTFASISPGCALPYDLT